jgi:hypothetical protein
VTFPTTPLVVLAEMFIGAAWVDVTDDVYQRDGTTRVTITRGRQSESGSAEPATCIFQLNNRSGAYSPKNPLSPHFEKFGRNTLVRFSVDGGERFYGEIAALPPEWDTSGNDAWVTVTAAGRLRRDNRGNQPTISGYKQFLVESSPITYWPLDDGSGSDRGWPAAGTYTGSTFHRQNGFAVYTFGDGILGAHLEPTLRINDTLPATGFDYFRGYCIGSDTTPDALAWDFVYRTDPAIAAGTSMSEWALDLVVRRGGGLDSWRLTFRPDGVNDDIKFDLFQELTSVVPLASSAALEAITDGQMHHVRAQIADSGADIDYDVWVDGVSVISGTHASYVFEDPLHFDLQYDRQVGDDLLCLGHLVIWENAATIPDITTTANMAHGFAGETAGRRIERLCDENGISFVSVGDLDATMPMGVQYEDGLSGQLAECESTDFGILYEPRDSLALAYRTRESLYNQTPAATISYSANEIDPPFEPVADDQYIHNDIFAQRRNGASFRLTKESGPLAIFDPPNGVGRYKDEVQVNCETDDMLPGIAGWILALGTIDEDRYPRLNMLRENKHVVANPTLSAALLAVDIGDLIVIEDAAAAHIYDDIRQIVIGYVETFSAFHHGFGFVCVPASPYDVATLDGANVKVSPGELTSLNEDLTTTETAMDITSDGFLWTTSAGQMPISVMVSGEEMTITAITGASNPQTATVTRSVNGVVKTHTAGKIVRLKNPARVAL